MSDVEPSSGDEAPQELELKHSVEVRLDLESEERAKIVCSALSVDKEPKRSNAVRELKREGNILLISVRSVGRRSLQKTVANVLDMCELSLSTLDMIDGKKWLEVPNAKLKQKKPPAAAGGDNEPVNKKRKFDEKEQIGK